jgi:hypothetical protein
LAGHDIHIKTHRLVSGSANLDVMVSGLEAKWLRVGVNAPTVPTRMLSTNSKESS